MHLQAIDRLRSRLAQSLTLKTMAWLGFPVVGISVLAIGFVYSQTLQGAEFQLRQDLERHLRDRSRHDQDIFRLAETNQKILKTDLMERLKQPMLSDVGTRFGKEIYQWNDKSYRNFPQGKDLKAFPSVQKATVFVGPQVHLSDQLKGQILLFEELTSLYGRAWYGQYNNTWIIGNQNISLDYRPGTLWGLEAPPSTDMTQEEYSFLATPEKNPDRSARWTSLYFDRPADRWMVSLVTPVDNSMGKHVATIGNDVVLNDLMEIALQEKFPNSYNLIFQDNGQIIVHPDRMDELKASDGKLNLQRINDPELQRIFQQAKLLNQPIEIIKDPQGKSFWAITKINGPNWYWVTVYPQSELRMKALTSIAPLVILGFLSLLIEIFLLYQILRRNVHQPLAKLVLATESLAQGNFEMELETDRRDEIGSLARSFSSMASQLQTSFSELSTCNETLATEVQDRTQELKNAVTDLQLTEAQLVQSEKMSSLGEMVAGIAHEVNNPIGFVHGNIEYAESYLELLLKHIDLFHTQSTVPMEIQNHAEVIDLAFLQTDLPKLLASMKIGTSRIQEIVSSLRNFSRLDGVEIKASNLHEGLDSTLLILNHRLKRLPQPPIVLEKNYGNLPLINCFPGLLNQVFMNIIGNAIDALEPIDPAKITITSELVDNYAEITISDNGLGIPETLIEKLFDPFFTTKEIGKGTGLGLSISHQIVVDRHQGTLVCRSSPEGTAFMIRIPIDSTNSPLSS
jgi:two-component system NtrC family sensor kinase